MFGLEKLVSGVVGTKPADIPHMEVESVALGERKQPEGRPLPKSTGSVEGFTEYLQRAEKIGYEPDQFSITFEKLQLVIAQNNILIYDDKHVDEWMHAMVKKEREKIRNPRLIWGWRLLSKLGAKSRKSRLFSQVRYQYLDYDYQVGGYRGEVFKQPYTKIIPEAVLTTAETILKNFEKTEPVYLLVSDYEVVQPDPFLAVAVPKRPFLIVDFWDEPGFKPKAAEGNSQQGLNT